jgi:hypothetical protein
MSTDELAALARRCWKILEAIHVPVYFTPGPAKEYEAIGLPPISYYFASRSAALGPASAELVTATFYSFCPDLVGKAVPQAWQHASPEQVLSARHKGIRETLAPVFGDAELSDAELAEAVELVREVTAGFSTAGRPLYAAHASLPWPEDPVLALWHGATLVREHRGDGHIAALLTSQLDPIEATITGGMASNTLRFNLKTRGFSEQEWADGFARLRDAGLTSSDTELSAAGNDLRAGIEDQTDRAATEGWDRIGVEGATRLNELITPVAKAIQAAELLPRALAKSKH